MCTAPIGGGEAGRRTLNDSLFKPNNGCFAFERGEADERWLTHTTTASKCLHSLETNAGHKWAVARGDVRLNAGLVSLFTACVSRCANHQRQRVKEERRRGGGVLRRRPLFQVGMHRIERCLSRIQVGQVGCETWTGERYHEARKHIKD